MFIRYQEITCDESQPMNPFTNNYVMSKYISELLQNNIEKFSIIDIE